MEVPVRPTNDEAAGVSRRREHIHLGDDSPNPSAFPTRSTQAAAEYPEQRQAKTVHHMQTTFTLG